MSMRSTPTFSENTLSDAEGMSPIKRKRMLPIRWTLPLCVVTPLVAGIALTSWLAFRSGQAAVEDLVGKISTEVAGNIEKQVTGYLVTSVLVSEAITAEVETGNLNTLDMRALGQNLWQLTRSRQLSNNLYFGSETGEFVYSENQGEEGGRLSFVDEDTGFRRIAYRADAAGNIQEALSTTDYDPRERPWYKKAVLTGRSVWSPVYVATSRDDLTLTRATPIYNSVGELQGVFGIDIYLYELSDFLRQLDIGENGQAFIIERSGELIATSTDENPFTVEGEEKGRLAATSVEDELVQATMGALIEQIGELELLEENLSFEFDLEGEQQLVHVYNLREFGIDWLIGVSVPQNDYMGTINANTRQTIIIGVLIALVASLIALIAALYIIRPIDQLNKAAKDIKQNQFNPGDLENVIARPDEFSELAELFNDMAIVVFSREQSLADQVKVLKTEIDQNGGSTSDRQKLEALLRRAEKIRKS
ncbi:MAG: cache domain-containing protein [Cyanobacteria bacterium J06573_11]